MEAKARTGKPVRRSLVEAAHEASEAELSVRRSGVEHAVLVAVEFTSQRRKLTPSAELARKAAAVSANDRDSEPSEFDTDDELQDVLSESWVDAFDDTEASQKARNERSRVAANMAKVRKMAEAATEPSPSDLDFDASLEEFQELARSAGAVISAVMIQRRSKPDPSTLVGGGKLDEIVATVASTGASLVLFDHDLTPSQARNVEARLPCTVIDRTQLILDIFARHARTREGQLQVELAQLEYQLPRLAGRGKAMSQLGGGIGTRGPGETQLETDRRKINLRLDHLKDQLESVRRVRRQQRRRREAVPVPVVALVGYTNAGKSTLFNALTDAQPGAGVLESARMFATLDPKLKLLQLPSRRKALLSDTVGFIRNLPHALVTSFRATLEEVERADLLLHVRDASSAMVEEQKVQVERVLAELDVAGTPRIEVMNKIDLVAADGHVPMGAPGSVAVSGLKRLGLENLLAAIDAALVGDPLIEMRFRIPQSEGAVLAALEAGAVLKEKRFEGNLAYVSARGPESLLQRYSKYQFRAEVPAKVAG